MENINLAQSKKNMIQEQIINRGILRPELLEALESTPRDKYVARDKANQAYTDGPLSIGYGQTISQPYIVAYMIDKLNLDKSDRVLEIGTGSGYNTAVMAKLASEVHTIEVVPELYRNAQSKLKEFSNVFVYSGDGNHGLPRLAPFNKIILTAAPATFPQLLWNQLAEGGIMIVPLGNPGENQKLYRYAKINNHCDEEFLMHVRFVPMVPENFLS